ncbi:MAG: alpha/beta hydrolase [bacterium]
MPKIHTNGTRIHYLQIGKGPDVVLLHGLGGNLAIWFLRLVDELRGRFRITALDLRGHGKSDCPPAGYTTRDMAEDLAGVLEGLSIGTAHLLGHSFGADVALHFSILHPERTDRMVLIEPGVAALLDYRKSDKWVGWDYWVGKLAEFGIEVPPEKRTDAGFLLRQTVHIPIQFGPARGRPRNIAPLLKLLDTTTILTDYEKVAGMTLDKIAGVRRPVLLVYGESSHFLVSYEQLKGILPVFRSYLIPGGSHYGPLEQPEMHVEPLVSFLLSEDAWGLLPATSPAPEAEPASKEAYGG